MSDPREVAFNGRVAHAALRGQVTADRYEPGSPCAVRVPVTDLCRSPGGARERQLVRGEGFAGLEDREGWTYGLADRDGYCGWIRTADLSAPETATHVVAARETYAKATPSLKATDAVMPLFLGSRLRIAVQEGAWCGVEGGGYVPRQHLRSIADPEEDPVDVALRFLGTPYLWGGNSGRGIDCSGLVQAAMLACGIACPGDSDQQAARLGEPVARDAPVLRGDLFFWDGHVAIAVDADTLLHANAHAMAVTTEPLGDTLARIAAQGDGPVTGRRRVTRPGE